MFASLFSVNGAPKHINLGAQDKSQPTIVREPIPVPQHCIKYYIFGQTGPTDPQLLVGPERQLMYGDATFDERGPYATHATIFANATNKEGTAAIYQRLVPEDAGPPANILVSLDVIPTQVPVYQRDASGKYLLDINGDRQQAGTSTVAGFLVKFVTSYRATNSAFAQFGQALISAGDQVGEDEHEQPVQSQRYPLFELRAPHKGSYGSNGAFRLWAPTTEGDPNFPAESFFKTKAYPFYLAMARRQTAASTSSLQPTLLGGQYVKVVLKPDTVDSVTDSDLYLGDVGLAAYQNLTDTRLPVRFGNFDQIAIYQDNIDELLAMFQAAEVAAAGNWLDFTEAASDLYAFNLFGGTTSDNIPYASYQFVSSDNAVRFSPYTDVFAQGGSDGTLTNAVFDALVRAEVTRYADPDDPVQNIATHPESFIYDSGFSLDTKKALLDFIALRKDTFVHLVTHEADQPILTESEENSIAVTLRSRAQLYPESSWFNTGVARASIWGRTATFANSKYRGQLPMALQIAIWSARYMGAGNGLWKSDQRFDSEGRNVITDMLMPSIQEVSATARNVNWSHGLNYPEPYDLNSFYYPAFRTVYASDVSVLTDYLLACALCYVNRVADEGHRYFSNSRHSNAVFREKYIGYMARRLQGVFDGQFKLNFDVQFTAADLQNGYSYQLVVDIGANPPKTVQTTYVRVFRQDQMPA